MKLDSDIEMARIRTEATEHFNGQDGFANANRLNVYECDGERSFRKGAPDRPGCRHFIVTIDREPGVTPFIVRCGNCGMSARSKGYNVADWLTPTHEWYRPDSLEGLEGWDLEHVKKGGLLLSPIGDAEWRTPNQYEQDRMAAMKAAMDRQVVDQRKMREADWLSRQALRHEKRKGKAPPETVTMYGRIYRLVDGQA